MSVLHTVFGLADFRRLFAGVTTSHLGDQFALIATPWLVLQLTGDPLTLGIVLALEGAPRAVFMLVGGAVTDRFSPRATMLICDIIRFALTALMALAILSGRIEMWMVYAFALGVGLVAGFAVPAGNSIVPMVVEEKDLEAGNAAVMGGAQVVGFVGPVAAGILIGTYTDSLAGVGIAFVIDALTFIFSALMFWQMQSVSVSGRGQDQDSDGHIWSFVSAGLEYVWQKETMRVTFLIVAAINLLFVGPLMVGIPVLAVQRLPEGASAFGLLIAGFSIGNLAGYLLAGTLPKPGGNTIRVFLIVLLAAFACSLGVLGVSSSTWIDFAILLGLGIGNGYVTIILISAIQGNTPKHMLGRIMGLFMFSSMGLVPISQAVSGAISRSDLTLLFMLTAALMVMVTIWATFQPSLSAISKALSEETGLE